MATVVSPHRFLFFSAFTRLLNYPPFLSQVDLGGSLAIASKGLFATGVSTDINISYISGVKQGEKIQVEARVDKLGKTLAFTTVEMFSNGRLGNIR